MLQKRQNIDLYLLQYKILTKQVHSQVSMVFDDFFEMLWINRSKQKTIQINKVGYLKHLNIL